LRWLVRNVLSSWVAAFLPVLAVCFLTLECPWVHEWLHSVGFAILGFKSVVVSYPVPRGMAYRCVPVAFVPGDAGFWAFHYFSLAIDFPYLACVGLLASVSLLYLAGALFTGRRFWFAVTLATYTLLAVAAVAFWVYPCYVAEWVRDVASFCGAVVI